MDLNEFKHAFFGVACDMQKLLHDTVAPVCQQNGLTLQQMLAGFRALNAFAAKLGR